MVEEHVRAAFATLFRETFEGLAPGEDGTWYVEGRESLFEPLDRLTPEQASIRVDGKVSSVAAHVLHTAYYISLSNANARGENPVVDWDGSWATQIVDAEGWREAGDYLRREYAELMAHLPSIPLHDEESATWLLAYLAHAAFHLGAIRQLVRLVEGS